MSHAGPLYDCLVVGGGPAGLSAALQLGRSNRHAAVVDGGNGRSTFRQVNHNYLGFPGGILTRELRELGRKQVSMYPVAFFDEEVAALRKRKAEFAAQLSSGRTVRSRTVILATGVTDHFPDVSEWEDYVGRSLFWCIVCDGYSARGKRVLAVGNDDEAAVTALQFLQFTSSVTLVTNHAACDVGAAHRRKCKRYGIELIVGEIASFEGDDGILCNAILRDGTAIPTDFVFSLQGGSPNNTLAKEAGASVTPAGYVVVDEDQHTSVKGLFAAGDLTHRHAHQVATAVHEGLTAATAVQYYLLEPWQR